MSEIDDLIAVKGVMIAGRFGPDWSLAEHKTEPLFFEVPAAMAVLSTFCSAIQSMFSALAISLGGLTPAQWTPVHGWSASGGDYTIVLVGSHFAIADTSQLGSIDEIARLLERPAAKGTA
ncbi:MAG: DUF2173 family protein [Acidimicrobiales bacterium]|jgi:roadblock/LC7 domain-containing protein